MTDVVQRSSYNQLPPELFGRDVQLPARDRNAPPRSDVAHHSPLDHDYVRGQPAHRIRMRRSVMCCRPLALLSPITPQARCGPGILRRSRLFFCSRLSHLSQSPGSRAQRLKKVRVALMPVASKMRWQAINVAYTGSSTR